MVETMEAKLLKFALYVIFIAGIIIVATLPLMIDFYARLFYDAYFAKSNYRSFILCFLTICGVLGLWIVVEMIIMMRSISKDPFIFRNVRSLRRIGGIALLIAVLFFLKCLLYITLLTFCVGLTFLVCSLFAFTLASLFKQAVNYKEENELTI